MALKGNRQWYCNACGKLFTPNDHSSRFCSRTCANRALVEFRSVPLYLSYQRRLALDVLRERKHQDVPLDYLAQRVLDSTDMLARRAVRGVVGRMAIAGAPYGLQIATVYGVPNNNLNLPPITHYRMDADFHLTDESQETAS